MIIELFLLGGLLNVFLQRDIDVLHSPGVVMHLLDLTDIIVFEKVRFEAQQCDKVHRAARLVSVLDSGVEMYCWALDLKSAMLHGAGDISTSFVVLDALATGRLVVTRQVFDPAMDTNHMLVLEFLNLKDRKSCVMMGFQSGQSASLACSCNNSAQGLLVGLSNLASVVTISGSTTVVCSITCFAAGKRTTASVATRIEASTAIAVFQSRV
jgi:hypothetical protein